MHALRVLWTFHRTHAPFTLPPCKVRSLDALHHMLHESSALVSHLRLYRGAVEGYASASSAFFDALSDFMASSGGGRAGQERVGEGQGVTMCLAGGPEGLLYMAMQGGLHPDAPQPHLQQQPQLPLTHPLTMPWGYFFPQTPLHPSQAPPPCTRTP